MDIECVLCFSHDDIPNTSEEEKNAENHVFLESVSGLIGIHLDLWIRICNSAPDQGKWPPKEKKNSINFMVWRAGFLRLGNVAILNQNIWRFAKWIL